MRRKKRLSKCEWLSSVSLHCCSVRIFILICELMYGSYYICCTGYICSRSKVYRFFKEEVYGDEKRENFWKERGKGYVRILRHNTTGIFRVLMRQDKTERVCVNHAIDPTIDVVSVGDYVFDFIVHFVTCTLKFRFTFPTQ